MSVAGVGVLSAVELELCAGEVELELCAGEVVVLSFPGRLSAFSVALCAGFVWSLANVAFGDWYVLDAAGPAFPVMDSAPNWLQPVNRAKDTRYTLVLVVKFMKLPPFIN